MASNITPLKLITGNPNNFLKVVRTESKVFINFNCDLCPFTDFYYYGFPENMRNRIGFITRLSYSFLFQSAAQPIKTANTSSASEY